MINPFIPLSKNHLTKKILASVITLGSTLALLTDTSTSANASELSFNSKIVTISATKPQQVPDGYTITPSGYFHPSCVISLSENQILIPDNGTDAVVTIPTSKLTTFNLAANSQSTLISPMPQKAGIPYSITDLISPAEIHSAPHIQACNHPHYSLDGTLIPAPSSTEQGRTESPPAISGWIESANSSSMGDMSYMYAAWTVPPAPQTTANQVIYFFPGFEDVNRSDLILQPVLAWTPQNGWYAQSWNCCKVGNVYNSKAIHVTGTTVSGDISGNGCNQATGVCSTWTIVTYDWGSRQSTTFNTTVENRVMNWVFGAALEGYNISSCSHLPGGTVRFRDFYLKDVRNNKRTPNWGGGVNGGFNPSCGYGVNYGQDGSVTLTY